VFSFPPSDAGWHHITGRDSDGSNHVRDCLFPVPCATGQSAGCGQHPTGSICGAEERSGGLPSL